MKSSSSSKSLSKNNLSKNKNFNPFVELDNRKNDINKNKDKSMKHRTMYKLPLQASGESSKIIKDKVFENKKMTHKREENY